MCRFLIVKSKKPVKVDSLLSDFANMCENNKQWQGDGWGVAWKLDDRNWTLDKSLNPIWEDRERFNKIPSINYLIIHARGASFPNQKGDIDYNQPYIDGDLCFVFNGELYGVKLKVDGKIGAQKIFNLLKKELKSGNHDNVLEKIRIDLRENSKKILGLNIGLVIDDKIKALCDFDDLPDYYSLRYYINKDITMICSERIGNYKWVKMKKGEII